MVYKYMRRKPETLPMTYHAEICRASYRFACSIVWRMEMLAHSTDVDSK
jgi:hypothetical protein